MKKTLLTLSVMAMSIFSANSVFAGGINFGTPAGPFGCWSWGLCSITWVVEPGSVSANYALDPNNGDLIMSISQSDMQLICPQNIPFFDLQTQTVNFPNQWIADPAFNQQIGARKPVTIQPGTYGFTLTASGDFVVTVPQQPVN